MIGIGVEEEDRKHTWMDDAESVSVPMTTHDSINYISNSPADFNQAFSILTCSVLLTVHMNVHEPFTRMPCPYFPARKASGYELRTSKRIMGQGKFTSSNVATLLSCAQKKITHW